MTPLHTDLLPCPFCGSDAIIIEHDGKTMSKHYTAQVMCGECSEVCAPTGWAETKERAIEISAEAWNRRTHGPQLAALVGEDAELKSITESQLENLNRLYAEGIRDTQTIAALRAELAAKEKRIEALRECFKYGIEHTNTLGQIGYRKLCEQALEADDKQGEK